MSRDILNVEDEPIFDDCIVKIEIHTYNPYANSTFGYSDEIRIPTGCGAKIRTNFKLKFPPFNTIGRCRDWHSNSLTHVLNHHNLETVACWNQVRSITEEPRLSKVFAPGARRQKSFACSDKCSEAVDGNCVVWKAICFPAGRCARPHKSFGAKLVVGQRRHVLVERILATQQPRFESFRLLRMGRGWKGHEQVQTSKRLIIESRYWRGIHRYGPWHIKAYLRTLQTENGGKQIL